MGWGGGQIIYLRFPNFLPWCLGKNDGNLSPARSQRMFSSPNIQRHCAAAPSHFGYSAFPGNLLAMGQHHPLHYGHWGRSEKITEFFHSQVVLCNVLGRRTPVNMVICHEVENPLCTSCQQDQKHPIRLTVYLDIT